MDTKIFQRYHLLDVISTLLMTSLRCVFHIVLLTLTIVVDYTCK